MSKKLLMSFADGAKEVSLGMEVSCDNGQSGVHKQMRVFSITKIGNKLVELSNGDQFYLESGRKKTSAPWGRLYSSPRAYIEANEANSMRIKISDSLLKENSLTYEQAAQIMKILGLE